MCVLKLVKGLLVSLITFSLGLGIVSLSISQEQTKTSNQSKTICVKEENPFENYEDGKMVRIPCEIDKEINVLEEKNIPQGFVKKVEVQKLAKVNEGEGCGGCYDNSKDILPKQETKKNSNPNLIPLKILSKPKPNYTDLARENNVEGIIRLKIVFSANGQIGAVTPISGLPNGLTEKAVESAKEIKFEPAIENGKPKSVTKVIEYSFSIY